jgi:hypothetical protein
MAPNDPPTQPQAPYVPPELVAHLDSAFPDRCPTMDMSEREIWAAAGARRVIERMRRMVLAQKTDNILERRI